MKNNWEDFKKKFPNLHTIQLQHVLQNYKFRGNKSFPRNWMSDECTMEANYSAWVENNSFPRFVVPRFGYLLNLADKTLDRSFYESLAKISSAFYTTKSMQSKIDNVLGKEEIARQETTSSSNTVSQTKSNNTIDLLAEIETLEVLSDINEISEGRSRTNSYAYDFHKDTNDNEGPEGYSRRRACSEVLNRESYKSFDKLHQSLSSPNVFTNKVDSPKPKRPPRRKKEKVVEKDSKSKEAVKLSNLKYQLINDFIPLKRKRSKKYKRMTLNSIKTVKHESSKPSTNNQLQVPLANFITSKSTSRSSSICSIKSTESCLDGDESINNIYDNSLTDELIAETLNSDKGFVSNNQKKGEMFPLKDISFCPVNFQSTNF